MSLNLPVGKKVIILITLAIVLRLFAMPFFMHMDLLSEFRRVNYIVENWSWYPSFNRLVVFYIESLSYLLTKWFFVDPDTLLYLPDPKHSTATITTHFIFTGDPHIYRHLFLFKLPYLIFDLLCAGVIWKYFTGHKQQVLALSIWLFNPVTIYATYFFGRFEVISIFFLLWTALCLKNHRWLLASIVFGLALNSREINLILIPSFCLALLCLWRLKSVKTTKFLLCVAIVGLSVFLPNMMAFIFGLEPVFTQENNILEVSRGISSFFDSKYNFIYPFFFLVTICYLYLIENNQLSPDHVFVIAGASIILPFFFGDFRSAHYFSWAIPFLVLACFYTKELFPPIFLLILFWVLHWLFNPTGANFTPLLATPIHESFFGMGNFLGMWQKHFSSHSVLNGVVLRDLFMTVTAACMLVILVRINQRFSTK